MAVPPRLESEVAELSAEYTIDLTEESETIALIFRDFGIGRGFVPATSDLLIRVPKAYPEAPPDMFWVDPTVLLSNGSVPQNADQIENYLGRQWRRFSWHWQGPWNPSINNLTAFLEFVRRRLREQR